MKAGRELDALRIRIAVEVFGWKETDKRLPDHDPNWLEYGPPWFELPDGSIFHYTHMPDYPRKIADAWLVVDAKEWELQMVVHKRGKHKGQTGAILSFDLFMEEREGILGDTPAHAICWAALAALVAVEVE